jgi:hypothetical protein
MYIISHMAHLHPRNIFSTNIHINFSHILHIHSYYLAANADESEVIKTGKYVTQRVSYAQIVALGSVAWKVSPTFKTRGSSSLGCVFLNTLSLNSTTPITTQLPDSSRKSHILHHHPRRTRARNHHRNRRGQTNHGHVQYTQANVEKDDYSQQGYNQQDQNHRQEE